MEGGKERGRKEIGTMRLAGVDFAELFVDVFLFEFFAARRFGLLLLPFTDFGFQLSVTQATTCNAQSE